MAELPELLILARQMNQTLTGETLREFDLPQPKCLNVPASEFQKLCGQKIQSVACRGKWLLIRAGETWTLLLNVGMGGDVYHYRDAQPADKYQVRVAFQSGAGFTVRFWWFGHFHLVCNDLSKLDTVSNLTKPLDSHPAGQLGTGALEISREALAELTRASRRNIKSLITDQHCIAGVGNAYIHDILFLARLHPLTPSSTLDPGQVTQLHNALRHGLQRVIDKNGLAFERDFFRQPGGFKKEDFLVGYHEKEPCPVCRAPVQKIKAAASASYICLKCQPLPRRLP